jgi:Fe-Mn family superoxide dismutase
MGSVALHELYFGNLGGFRRAGPNSGLGRPDWHEVPDALAAEIAADFSSASAWRREFVATAQSLAGGSGWVLLTYSRRQKRFSNQVATDHTQAAVDAAPVLVLDMYEHAYQMDFGANATAYTVALGARRSLGVVRRRGDAGDAVHERMNVTPAARELIAFRRAPR